MTDADLSREEWVQERLAIMAADGMKFDERQARAEAVVAWERLRVALGNGARSHGDSNGDQD